MLHAKIKGHRPLGSGDFLKSFNINGHDGHLGICDLNHTGKISCIPPITVPYQISL